jgi:hypothetical protein
MQGMVLRRKAGRKAMPVTGFSRCTFIHGDKDGPGPIESCA